MGKLLDVASIGSALASAGMMHRFLSGMAKTMLLVTLSAFMLCALLANVFIMAYFCLVHYGLDPFASVIALSLVALMINIAFLLAVVSQLRQLRNMSRFSLGKLKSDWPDLGNIIGAFVDGYLSNKG